MSLPNLPAGDKFRREVRTEWGGLNLNENAGDGELIVAMNMSSREYPLLANSKLWYRNGNNILHAPFYHNGIGGIIQNGADPTKLNLLDSTKTPMYRGEISGGYTIAEKIRHAIVNHKLYIMPSKQVYDCNCADGDSGSITNMEASWTTEFHIAHIENVDDYDRVYPTVVSGSSVVPMPDFKVGDALTISGCVLHQRNNTTAILRKITQLFDTYTLHFDAGTFDRSVYAYTDSGTLPAGTYWFWRNPRNIGTGAPVGQFTLTAAITSPQIAYYFDHPTEVFVRGSGVAEYAVAVTEGDNGTNLYFAETEGDYANEPNALTITRAVPDMDYICENENRLWGCKGDTIYASKLGDPLNWYVFDGLSTDCWSAQTGTPGDFTGCCSFQGYPIFFKAGEAFRVVGDLAENFTLRRLNVVGVAPACDRSIVEIRGKLYYLSPIGIVEWNGGDYPQVISHALTGQINKLAGTKAATGGTEVGGVAGTDGLRYFIELQYQATQNSTINRLFVYDTRFGSWHELERGTATQRAGFCGDGATFWMIRPYLDGDTTRVRQFLLTNPKGSGTSQYMPGWEVRFADSTRAYKTALTGSESKKGVLRLLIRCKLAGSMKIWISYDGGAFEEAGEFGGEDGMDKSSRVVPLILRRCDYWQLRLTGAGDAVIYSIAVEKYGGEWQQA